MSTADDLVKYDALSEPDVLAQGQFDAEEAKLLEGSNRVRGLSASQSSDTFIDELVKFDALRQAGALTQEEFDAEKAKLLAGILSSAGFGASQAENGAPAPSTCANRHPMHAEHASGTKFDTPRAKPDEERHSMPLDTAASTPTAQHRRVRVILVFCIALILIVVSIVLVVSLSGGVNTSSISYKDGYAWAEGAWQNSCSVDGVSDPVLCEVDLTGSSPVTAHSLVSENCTGASMAIAEPSDNLDEWVAGCSAALQAAYNENTGSADTGNAGTIGVTIGNTGSTRDSMLLGPGLQLG
jgi:hypothetical protein